MGENLCGQGVVWVDAVKVTGEDWVGCDVNAYISKTLLWRKICDVDRALSGRNTRLLGLNDMRDGSVEVTFGVLDVYRGPSPARLGILWVSLRMDDG